MGYGHLYMNPMEGNFIGVVFIIGGILTMLQHYFHKKKHGTEYVICEKCSKKIKLEHIQIAICPLCDVKLVLYKENNSEMKKKIT